MGLDPAEPGIWRSPGAFETAGPASGHGHHRPGQRLRRDRIVLWTPRPDAVSRPDVSGAATRLSTRQERTALRFGLRVARSQSVGVRVRHAVHAYLVQSDSRLSENVLRPHRPAGCVHSPWQAAGAALSGNSRVHQSEGQSLRGGLLLSWAGSNTA